MSDNFDASTLLEQLNDRLQAVETNLQEIFQYVKKIDIGMLTTLTYDVQQISLKVDSMVGSNTKNIQRKRTDTQSSKKRHGGPRYNILVWIKDQYIEHGWKFFSFILEDAEETIKNLLLEFDSSESNKKKIGIARKKAEAAFIWHRIKAYKEIEEGVKLKFEEWKEDQKRELAKLAEKDESSDSDNSNNINNQTVL